jgi:hypothetical protein
MNRPSGQLVAGRSQENRRQRLFELVDNVLHLISSDASASLHIRSFGEAHGQLPQKYPRNFNF